MLALGLNYLAKFSCKCQCAVILVHMLYSTTSLEQLFLDLGKNELLKEITFLEQLQFIL